MPGISTLTAMTLLTELCDISRFKTLDKLCSYFGLIPNTNSSGETDRKTGMNGRRNVQLRMVLIEGALIGLLSWLLASLAAFPISILMSNAISQSLFGGSTDFGFTLTGFVIWLASVIVLSVLASVMPARNAAHLTIREVLSYE